MDDEKFQIGYAKTEVGQTYPIFGMLTDLNENPDMSFLTDMDTTMLGKQFFQIEVNKQIILFVPSREDNNQELVDTLKNRMFDTAIFISTILENDPVVIGYCSTVIFGKQENKTMN
jgi:hypothetical protein